MTRSTYPTGAQLYAYEAYARRERARMQAEVIRMLFSALKEAAGAIFLRSYAKPAKAVLNG